MAKPVTFIAPTAILSSIGGIAMDAAVTMTHLFEYRITESPVASGESMADHKYREPIKIDIQGVLTDTPFPLMRRLELPVSDLQPGDKRNLTALSRAPRAGRSIEAFDALRRLADGTELFTVITGIYIYRNMLFERLSAPATSKDGFSINFTASVREVLFNDTVATQASLSRIDQNRAAVAAGLVNLGAAAAIQVSNALAPRIVPQIL